MKTAIANKIRQIDYLFNSAYLKIIGERKSLIIFLFHVLFRDLKEHCSDIVHPQQGITLESLRQLIEYYLNNGYVFVSPDDVVGGLDSNKNYAMLTFDDGYFNNRLALPLLNQYKIPAVFFISTENIKHSKPFFWDVMYRELEKRGIPTQTILEKINSFKLTKTNAEIEKYITDEFGKVVLIPRDETDRPFTPSELKDFAKEKFVFLGNHTNEHGYLENYSPDQIRSSILVAQESLFEMTGKLPEYISYPDGSYSGDVIKVVKQLGFKLGMAVDNRKNYLPIDFHSDKHLRLGRFSLGQNTQLIKQCQLLRSDIRLTKVIKSLIGKE